MLAVTRVSSSEETGLASGTEPGQRQRRFWWLAYLPVVFLEPAIVSASAGRWMALIVGLAIFLGAFAVAVRGVRGGLQALILVGVMAGAALSPWNLGAVVFFSYAAGACAYLQRHAVAVAAIIGIAVVGAVEAFAFNQAILLPLAGLLPSCVGILFLYMEGLRRTNDRLRMANAEIERLAGVAERERIARDLHDVLGHTLSLIAVKSELAARLAESAAPEAARESRDVQAASRTALSEIRQVIRGYRAALIGEAGAARAILEAAGVEVTIAIPALNLRRDTEAVLALVLREAVTNVVRHADASQCRIVLERRDGVDVLTIADDGRGIGGAEGNGIRGMRARVEAAGGTIECARENGTAWRVSFAASPDVEEAS